MATYTEQMQNLYEEYVADGNKVPVETKTLARWAISSGRWKMRPEDVVRKCAEELSRAFRQEYRTDETGKRIRTKHAAQVFDGEAQKSLWCDIDTAPRAHMQRAFSQRRKQIVGDCHQLANDVGYYNRKNEKQAPIQLLLDFTDDVEELQMLEESGEDVEAA